MLWVGGPAHNTRQRVVQTMTTTPLEPRSDPDVTPGGDPPEPNPPAPDKPEETEHPD